MSGDAVVVATAIGVLIVAIVGGVLVAWWVWLNGTDKSP